MNTYNRHLLELNYVIIIIIISSSSIIVIKKKIILTVFRPVIAQRMSF